MTTLHPPRNAEVGRHGALSIGWFALLIAAGGFLTFVQDFLFETFFPLEVIIRVLCLIQIFYILVMGRFSRQRLPNSLVLSILLLAISMLATLVLQLVNQVDVRSTLRAFYFMFGTGAFIVFQAFVPLKIRRIPLFTTFIFVCILFGTLQVLSQDLYLSNALLTEFGITHVLFTNGSVRAISFFQSAPRFAELLVFVVSWLLFDIASRRRYILLKLVIVSVCVWLLFNTFSRSGYILFFVATTIIVLGQQRQIFGELDIRGLLWRGIIMTGLVFTLLAVAGFVDFEQLAVFNTISLQARLEHWSTLQQSTTENSFLEYLFGSGRIAMFRASETYYFVVDSLHFTIAHYCGFFGVCAFVFLVASTIRVVTANIREDSNSRMLPMLALYVGLLFEGLFVDNHNTVFFVQICIIAMIQANWRTKSPRAFQSA